MRTNTPAHRIAPLTHEGAKAYPHLTVEQALRRSVLSCMLFEDEFYEDGASIAERIKGYAHNVSPEKLAAIAIEAREDGNLRHVPLWLLVHLCETGRGRNDGLVSKTIARVIKRADEPAELLALYWKSGKKPLSKQLKLGLAEALGKFSEYNLAKYDRDGAVKLRDVMFLSHPKPKDGEREALHRRIAERTLATPDTWEVELSAKGNNKESWERLLNEGKLGYLALLRNLRNMDAVSVDPDLIAGALIARRGAEKVLPFRYVTVARHNPAWEPVLDRALCAAIAELPPLPGRTVLLVDVSASMSGKLSGKTELSRMDAAATLASMVNGNLRVFTFSNDLVEVPPRRGMAGVDAIRNSQFHSGTRLFDAVQKINETVSYNRLIVLTDEQAAGPGAYGYRIQGALSTLPNPTAKGYMINVASAQNGVGYGQWTHIDGFSEATLKFILACEGEASSND